MKALRDSECCAWDYYSQSLKDRILNPQNAGFFLNKNQSSDRYLACGQEGSFDEGALIVLYILFDTEDFLIVDAKFQAFGQSCLIGFVDKMCELLIKKNIFQARKITADLIETSLRDQPQVSSCIRSDFVYINKVVSAIDNTLSHIPEEFLNVAQLSTPLQNQSKTQVTAYPEFFSLSLKNRLKIIQDVIDQDIAPYIALDDGGVSALDIKNEKEVIIAYSGTCTSCYSSIGSTLSAIEQTLKDKVHPELIVTPDMNSLNF